MLTKSYTVHGIHPTAFPAKGTVGGVETEVTVHGVVVELVANDGASGTIKLNYLPAEVEEALAFFVVGDSITLSPFN